MRKTKHCFLHSTWLHTDFLGKGVRIEHFRVSKHDEPYVKLSEFVFGVQTPDLDLWVPVCPGGLIVSSPAYRYSLFEKVIWVPVYQVLIHVQLYVPPANLLLICATCKLVFLPFGAGKGGRGDYSYRVWTSVTRVGNFTPVFMICNVEHL